MLIELVQGGKLHDDALAQLVNEFPVAATDGWAGSSSTSPTYVSMSCLKQRRGRSTSRPTSISTDRETDEGFNWTVLSRARHVVDVVAGSAVVMGSAIGSYLAKVVAWDFEASDDYPMVVLDLVPLSPRAVEQAPTRTPAR